MNRPFAHRQLRGKLLLSYGLVAAAGIGGLVLGVQVVGPSLFDRLLAHMDGNGGTLSGAISEAMRRDMAAAFRTALLQALLLATVGAAVTAFSVSLFMSRRITAPLTRLVGASRHLAHGEYSARVPIEGEDELTELAAGFNEMAAALEDTERRRVHLIGDVAHELRTPLATLSGYLEGLRDGVIEPEPALWEQLYGESARLRRLVDDLRELSRVEVGRVALHQQPVTPSRLVDAALARLGPGFAAKGVAFGRVVPNEVVDVLADEDRTVQILTNVIANALRYTPPGGGVTVAVRTDPTAVRFEVRDTGVGIAAEHLPHVFDRFFRVDPSRSRSGGGSGIGLTIAKALVEAQGGRIWAESLGAGRGTTFTFTLPRARRRSVPRGTIGTSSPRGGADNQLPSGSPVASGSDAGASTRLDRILT